MEKGDFAKVTASRLTEISRYHRIQPTQKYIPRNHQFHPSRHHSPPTTTFLHTPKLFHTRYSVLRMFHTSKSCEPKHILSHSKFLPYNRPHCVLKEDDLVSYLWPLILTIIANAAYQLSARGISSRVDPLFSLCITYGVALLGALIMYLLSKHQSLQTNLHMLNWASVTMGLAITFVELGYLLTYRAGAPVGSTAITVNAAITLLLIPIGLIFFHEGFSLRNGLGFILAVVSLYLLNS